MTRKALRPRRAPRQSAPRESPPTLSVGAVTVIFGAAGIAAALGLSVVHLQFNARDHQIEARRLQELAGQRRDDVRKLETHIGFLTRDESLREAALGPLGMVEPSLESVQDLEVDAFRARRLVRAERAARARMEELREEYESLGREVH